jgi:hypothetical protein
MTEENTEPQEGMQVSIEQAIQMYEAKIQEQTTIMFGLVAKLGGSVEITQEDFDSVAHLNTVAAEALEGGGVRLVLTQEEREESEGETE